MEKPALTELIDISVLQRIQEGFSRFTGMAALTTDADGTPVTVGSGFTEHCMDYTRTTPLGCERCAQCDKMGAIMTLESGRASVYECHAGLVDYAAPIVLNGTMVGSFIGGQIRTSPFNEQKARAVARELGLNEEDYIKAAKKINIIDEDYVKKCAEFLSEIAAVLSEMAYASYTALSQSRKLELLARSKNTFMSDVNNELKKSINRWLETARRMFENAGSDKDAVMDRLISEGNEFLMSIGEAIEYSGAIDAEIELNENVYCVSEILNRTADRLRHRIKKDGVTITVRIDNSVPRYLMGDAGRISQIISRLAMCVAGRTKNGSINIDVSCESKSYAALLKLDITAVGCDITPEKIEELCVSFESDVRSLEGEQIEANITRLLVKRLSGSLTINGKEGEVLFSVVLPQLVIGEGSTNGL